MNQAIKTLTTIFLLLFSFHSLAHDWSGKSEDLERHFKKLSRSYKDLRRSRDLDDITQAYQRFDLNLQNILNFQISANPEESEIFQQGTNRLREASQLLGQSIANKESADIIKEHIRTIGNLRKEYHKKLDVGD